PSEPTTEAVKVSTTCADAVEKQGKEYDEISATATDDTSDTELNAPYMHPLEDCKSFAEYAQAGIDNPAPWGMEWNKEEDMKRMVGTACFNLDPKSATPVCADAKELGLLS
ncbi:hypothetical protein, partial [Paeniglutamicibacter cryotolerans]